MRKNMRKDFDTVLGECLEQVLEEKASMEACLARYPQYAEELRQLLETALVFQQVEVPEPSREALDLAKHRLLRAVEEKRLQRTPGGFLGWFVGAHRLRWARAVAALVVLVAVGSTVALASGNSLPGQPLYPVKRGIEEIRLAFTFSTVGKADLHIVQAERRAEEMALMADTADAEKIGGLAQAIESNLAEAQSLAARLEGTEQSEEFRARLQRSASTQLSLLETSLAEASEEIRPAVSDAFKVASQSYGQAVEAVALKGPAPLVAARGFIQLLASDPPPPALDNVFIEVAKIEAHLAAGSDSGWITIVESPNTFDLLAIDEIHKFLGQQEMPAGTYTQIRFEISEAVVVAQGEAHVADVPSGKIRIIRPFAVEDGEITVVTIDFDGQRSVKVTGGGKFKLDPNVKLLVSEPSRGKTKPPEPGTVPPSPQIQSRKAKVEIEGRIEEISDTHWVVSGQIIAVTSETEVEGTPQVGLIAEVVVRVQDDGSLKALEAEVKTQTEGGLGKIRFEGPIEALDEDTWKVAGRTIEVTPSTEIEGEPQVGSTAKVKALVGSDGAFTALEIEIKEQETGRPGEGEMEGTIEAMEGDVWHVGGRLINITPETEIVGDPQVGVLVEVEGLPQPDGSIAAVKIEVSQAKEARPGKVELEGVIEVMGNETWEVGGRTVNITSDTEMKGQPLAGRVAKVKGVVQPDGTVVASEVEVEEPEEAP